MPQSPDTAGTVRCAAFAPLSLHERAGRACHASVHVMPTDTHRRTTLGRSNTRARLALVLGALVVLYRTCVVGGLMAPPHRDGPAPRSIRHNLLPALPVVSPPGPVEPAFALFLHSSYTMAPTGLVALDC